MASTNKTTHYELSQFLANDKPAWLTDYNNDMMKIDNAIYAVHEEAQEGGLPDGGTNGQVLTQTAGGTPTWADIPEAKQIAGNPILPNMTADQIAITMKNYNGNIDTLYQSGFYQIVSGATGTLPWSGVNGSVLQVAGNGTGVGTWQIISNTSGKVMARACTGGATWTSWKEVGSTIATGVSGNTIKNPLSGNDLLGMYGTFTGNIDEITNAGIYRIVASTQGTKPSFSDRLDPNGYPLIHISSINSSNNYAMQLLPISERGIGKVIYYRVWTTSWSTWQPIVANIGSGTPVVAISQVASLPPSPNPGILYLIPEE